MTTVVNFHHVKQHWNAQTQQWDDPKFVYIGRPNRHYNLPGSAWGNYPNQGIDFYHDWIQQQREFARLDELRGKTLVCWCKPDACHGDALLELLGESAKSSAQTAMAISLWEPWGTLVAIEAKRYETRHWKTSYRGDLVICTAKKRDREILEGYEALRPEIFRHGVKMEPCRFGVALCVVTLVDCIPTEFIPDDERRFGNFAPGRFAWDLQNVRRFDPPIAARGKQGLWKWDGPLPEMSSTEPVIAASDTPAQMRLL